jgi:tRNA (guanine-N7-)-methyltransferase
VKDAETLLRRYVAKGSVAEVHLYHPQPFHDSRQSHRRVFTPRFLADVQGALGTGGLFVVQTDNPDYWRYMVRVLPQLFQFQEHDGPWPDAPEGRTRREILARSRGLRIYRGFGTKRDDLDAAALEALVRELPLPTFRSRGPWIDLDRLEITGQDG